jgi:hypothetical protein
VSVPSQIATRDTDGSRPMIPPHLLLEVLRRIAGNKEGK